MRVRVESYEVEGPEKIMVYGTDESGAKVCFRVVGPGAKQMRKRVDTGERVEVELGTRSN